MVIILNARLFKEHLELFLPVPRQHSCKSAQIHDLRAESFYLIICFQIFCDPAEFDFYRLFAATCLYFHSVVLDSAADDDSEWKTDQVGIGEFDASAFFSVIIEHPVFPAEYFIQLFSRILGIPVLWIRRNDVDIERSHRFRPDDAAVVMVTFNDRCQRTRNTYAVTSHQYGYTASVLNQYIVMHAVGIFCAELEYLSDFDSFHEFYITASILSLRTFCDEAEITRARNFKVTSVVDVDIMI